MTERVEPRRLLAALSRNRRLVLLLFTAGVIAGVGIGLARPPAYQARTSVLISEPLQTAHVSVEGLETSQDLARTYSEVAREEVVLSAVIRHLDLDTSWRRLRERVNASVSGSDRHLIQITVEAGSPREASLIAAEIPLQLELFLSRRSGELTSAEVRDFIWSRLEAMEQHIETSEHDMRSLRRLLDAGGPPGERRDLQDQLDASKQLLLRWQQSYVSTYGFLERFGPPSDVVVLERPTVAPAAVGSDAFVLGVSAATGLLAGFLATYAMEFKGSASLRRPRLGGKNLPGRWAETRSAPGVTP